MPGAALAFSGFGVGTQATPYRISTCAQLGEMANNLAGYYVLNNNINCGGATFTPVGSSGSPFTGTLDGQDHTITNLNFTTCGIFCNAGGNATIENLNLTGGTFTDSVYGSAMGTFVGELDGATLSNLHSSLTMTGSSGDQYVGGIAGLIWSGTNSIANSSYIGSITVPDTDAYIGGLVGYAGSIYSLSNDHATPTIILNSGDGYLEVGGLVGANTAHAITNSYSAGSITNSGTITNSVVGGFAGIFGSSATIQNSFSATSVNGSYTGSGDTAGAVYGTSGGINTNMYFDESRATLSGCSGDSQTSCTAVNVSNANPSYFFNNKTNAPLNSWDFNNTWSLGSSYPTLKSEATFVIPSSIPNSGDANNDGIQDAYQPNVEDIEDTSSVWATVTVPSANNCLVGAGQSIASTSIKADGNYPALTNPVDFNVYCLTTGATVPITIIYDRVYTDPSLVFYNSSTETYTSISGAKFSTVTIGSVARTEVTYSATDGGAYDADGLSNGVITDPVDLVGPAVVAAPDTGYGAPTTSNIWLTFGIEISFSVSLILVGAGLKNFSRPKSE
jgi:hypothetical protein